MLNPFFLNGSQSEQGLVQDLINEQLRMYGVEVYYLPRTYVTTNTIIREVIQSEFNDALPIEAYVDTYDGYGGQGTILSKFGIQNIDELQITISRERYENYISPLIRNIPNDKLTARPKEGDLIYFPLGDRIFEIKYVEHEQPFYQLKKNYVYQLKCELFRYEDEVIDTGINQIDDDIEKIGYIQTLNLIGAGSTATATSTYCASGSVRSVVITNMGGGYTSIPDVGFSSAPSGGTTAIGIASITDRYYNCLGDASGKVAAVNLINAGCGYTVAPWVNITGGGGSGAAATTGINTTGAVMSVVVNDGGSGYSTAPSVTFVGGGSTVSSVGFVTAKAISKVNTTGSVVAVYIEDSGQGYVQAPSVVIAGPLNTDGIGIGTYVFNEIVTGQTSNTTARVKTWNAITNELEISIVDGEFTVGELVVGSESNAKYKVGITSEYDYVTPYAQNDHIEAAADQILDFSSSNPFGMP